MNNNAPLLKRAFFSKLIIFLIIYIAIPAFTLLPSAPGYAVMDDYCVIPPFIVGGGMKSNLLLTIDNSGSMYDLSYVDEGKQDALGTFTRQPNYCYDQTYKSKVCSNDRTQSCTVDGDCAAGEVCEDKVYAGYFEIDEIYSYNSGSGNFQPGAAFPLVCSNSIPNTLCVNIAIVPPSTKASVTAFVAKGNYLNWLTASKFDVEKQILTGGKYDVASKNLIAETRGCVGRGFVKEANLTGNFINYNDGDVNPNTSLQIVFRVKGPLHSINPTAPSPGGQTSIEIFEGDYQQKTCDEAVDCFAPPGCTLPDTRNKVKACIAGGSGGGAGVSYCASNPSITGCVVKQDCPKVGRFATCAIGGGPCSTEADCIASGGGKCAGGNAWDTCLFGAAPSVDVKVVFAAVVQECWQHLPFNNPGAGWTDAQNTIKNFCPDIYKNYEKGLCSVTTTTSCNQDSDCPAAEVCNNGPRAITPGNPALICGINYGGKCYTGGYSTWASTWTSDACLTDESIKFCADLDLPPVIDPTDDPSDTSFTANLPAIIADIGVEAQLGEPIATFYVKVDRTADPDPKGLVQEFQDRILFGAQSFNFNGSLTECGIDPTIPCPKVCSAHNELVCSSDVDCPDFATGETCKLTTDITVNRKNYDGAKIIHYIGTPGVCSIDPTTSCSEDSDCPDYATGETCNLAGNHAKGTCSATPATSCSYDYECPVNETCENTLVHTIDSIRGEAWTPFSEGFLEAIGYFARTNSYDDPPPATSRIDIRLNTDDYVEDNNPSKYKCQGNNILLISDGMSTADQNPDVLNVVSTYNDGDGLTGTGVTASGDVCPKYSGSRNLDDLAWLAQNKTITDFTQDVNDPMVAASWDPAKTIKTYAIYTGASSNDPDECNPKTLLQETAGNGGGEFAWAEDPEQLKDAIRKVFLDVSGKASSGTAASVLASGEESGANLLQAIFYPSREFEGGAATLEWSGTLQNLWYYIHPLFKSSTIREDTDQNNILHLKNDYIARYHFVPDPPATMAYLLEDTNGNFVPPPVIVDDIPVENLKNIWESGKLLWQRDISAAGDPRNIKTYIGDKALGKPVLKDFSTAGTGIADLRPYLRAANDAESEAIIRYIHGEDTVCSVNTTTACSKDTDCPSFATGETCGGFNPIVDTVPQDGIADFTGAYRKRTVGIDLSIPPDGDVTDLGEKNVWKLGDIISSTPKVISWVPLNNYDLIYSDSSYKRFICKDKAQPCISDYDIRGRVFTGANDGMLHAFKLGQLQLKTDPAWSAADFEEARILDPVTGVASVDAKALGDEIWAFIPKHVLPYLKYNAETGYCHLFNVDGMPYIFDASIDGAAGLKKPDDGSSWRTILIGSMKSGGACREDSSLCTNCVKTPALPAADAAVITAGGNDASRLGLSSYFAIDITDKDPDNWTLLWEFSDENINAAAPGELADGGLGFSTAGPAVVRINPSACADAGGTPQNTKKCNGEWFVAIPSGPTGPIDTTAKQFMGRSDQKLKVFVINLRDGAYRTAIKDFGGEITNAFSGSALDSVIDPDLDYQDDAFYLGYSKSSTGLGDSWTEGGVVKVMTLEDPDPSNWVGRKLIDGIGPITAAVTRLEDTNNNTLWIYFGTGRYYYKQLGVIDDAAGARAIYGVKDPCYISPTASFNTACVTTVAAGDLDNVTVAPNNPEDAEGWVIDLEGQNIPELKYDAERVISDPVPSTIGATFFTTFKPSSDVCGFGGRSHLWAVKYNTGGTATSVLRGKALLQVSTGAIEEIDLKDAFKETIGAGSTNPDSHDDRRTGAMTGKPPEGPGLILLTAPPPSESVIHMREK